MKKKNAILLTLVFVAVIAVAVIGLTSNTFTTNTKPVANTNNAATNIAFSNNGNRWVHFNAVIENMPMKDGTKQNFYIQGYIKPNGNNNIDLGNLGGYGNQQLPAGTTIRVLSWKGYCNAPSNTNNLIKVSKDPTNFNVPSSQKVFEENIWKFDSKGKVSMISTTPCTLCKILAHPKKHKKSNKHH